MTARLHLVRHGDPVLKWDAAVDPRLSELGHSQATAVADELASSLSPQTIFTSPLLRCRETSRPLAERWGVEPIVESRVAEIPSPVFDDDPGMSRRMEWLREVMAGDWPASGSLRGWRDDLVGWLAAQTSDAVVFTHFVAINVVVGAAKGDERVMCCRPGNCCYAVVDVDERGRIELVTTPLEAMTEVL